MRNDRFENFNRQRDIAETPREGLRGLFLGVEKTPPPNGTRL
jgi:hypothetical protein